jgi:DNA-directed RNA polymerase subunit RPC12/RpoP
MNNETYSITFICSNCSHSQVEEISKGEKIEHIEKDIECKHCGCTTLGKTYPKYIFKTGQ